MRRSNFVGANYVVVVLSEIPRFECCYPMMAVISCHRRERPGPKRKREIKMDEFQTFKNFLAAKYGLAIIGTQDYFDNNKVEVSAQLREMQEFINGLVVEHDKLADEKAPNRRLVGKRGRKAQADKKVTTVDDVMKRLSK